MAFINSGRVRLEADFTAVLCQIGLLIVDIQGLYFVFEVSQNLLPRLLQPT